MAIAGYEIPIDAKLADLPQPLELVDHRLREPYRPDLPDLWPHLGLSSAGAGPTPASHAGGPRDQRAESGAQPHGGVPHAAARMDGRFHLASDAVRARRRAARGHSAPGHTSADVDIGAISSRRPLTHGRGLADTDRFDGGLTHGAALT